MNAAQMNRLIAEARKSALGQKHACMVLDARGRMLVVTPNRYKSKGKGSLCGEGHQCIVSC